MTPERYAEFIQNGLDPAVMSVEKSGCTDAVGPLLLGAIGLCGEAGEVSELVKKEVFHGKPIDRAEIVKEMGDVLWYLNLLMNEVGVTLDEVMETNVRKLCERRGEQYGKPETWLTEEPTLTLPEALQLAGMAWMHSTTKHKEVDGVLAYVFADILMTVSRK